MAVTATPVFTQTPKRATAQVTTAVATLDAPAGTTLFTAGTNGSKVFEIVCQGYQASIAAGVVRIFIGTASNAGRLFDEFVCTAVTGSSTAAMWRLSRAYDNFLCAASDVVVVTTSVTQNINVHALYADF